jgi:hypothetical protein
VNARLGILLEALKRDKTNLENLRLIKTALQAWVTGLILGVIGYALFQVVPVYMESYQLEEASRKEARLASANWKSDAAVQDVVFEKAGDLGLPVDRQDIHVASSVRDKPVNGVVALLGADGEPATIADVDIDVSYSVPVVFPGHTFYLKFRFHADDHSA